MYSIIMLILGVAFVTVRAAPTTKSKKTVHNLNKRNFVPNRFDIVDNEIKHSIQKEVENALRKNFIPDNPLLEDSKWGRTSPAKYPVNQPSMIYGMEYDQVDPSRSDPGYLVLDLKQLAKGQLKFHEQKIGALGKYSARKPPGGKKQHGSYKQGQPAYNNKKNDGYQHYNQPQQQHYQPQQQQPQQFYQQQYYQQQQQPQQFYQQGVQQSPQQYYQQQYYQQQQQQQQQQPQQQYYQQQPQYYQQQNYQNLKSG